MSIEVVNIGNIANDGTGDDLREAFRKVNDNFENIDLRVAQVTFEPVSGENLGAIGEGLYTSTQDSVLKFKKLVSGSNINLNVTDTSITLDVPTFLDQLIAVTDSGSVVVQNGQSMTVTGGTGITTEANGQNLIISAGNGILSTDHTPRLVANLDAHGNDIFNATDIVANTFFGSLEGLVYGVDVRDLTPFLTGFNFGAITPVYDNAFEFLLSQIDIDFGSIVGPNISPVVVDQGSFV